MPRISVVLDSGVIDDQECQCFQIVDPGGLRIGIEQHPVVFFADLQCLLRLLVLGYFSAEGSVRLTQSGRPVLDRGV